MKVGNCEEVYYTRWSVSRSIIVSDGISAPTTEYSLPHSEWQVPARNEGSHHILNGLDMFVDYGSLIGRLNLVNIGWLIK